MKRVLRLDRIILILLLLLFMAFLHFLSRKPAHSFSYPHTTLLLGVEHRSKMLSRGWNDITMLMIEEKDGVKFVSFPRDSLVYIPPKGHFIINSLYLVTGGAKGTVNHLAHNYKNLKIDDYLVFNMADTESFAKELLSLPIPAFLKRLAEKYIYVDEWVRCRKSLRFEIDRQERIHAFMSYLSDNMKKSKLSDFTLGLLGPVLLKNSEESSIDATDLVRMYHSVAEKPVTFYIWPGRYRDVYFNLALESTGYVFWEGRKAVYVTDKVDAKKLVPYAPSYEFSFKEFLKVKGTLPSIRYTNNPLYGTYTSWNGDWVINPNHLVSDYVYTNQDFTLLDALVFIAKFKHNSFTQAEIEHIVAMCRKYHINFLVAASQLQKEASLIANQANCPYRVRMGRAMGYDCGTVGTNEFGDKIGKYHNFSRQVELGLWCMRKHFDAYKKGIKIKVFSFEGELVPDNAATYSLYMYTPFYGEAYPYGELSVGNRRFMGIFYDFRRIWNSVRNN